jgi:hypothetical protein
VTPATTLDRKRHVDAPENRVKGRTETFGGDTPDWVDLAQRIEDSKTM